jgi:hypothetical protein
MKSQAQVLLVGGAASVALFAFAFVAAPHSCEWGLTAYFWAGVATLTMCLALPIGLRTDCSVLKRVLMGLGFAALGLGVWVAGLATANVRIMCRLF